MEEISAPLLTQAFLNDNGKYAIQLKKHPSIYEDVLIKFIQFQLKEFENKPIYDLFEFINPYYIIPNLFDAIFQKLTKEKNINNLLNVDMREYYGECGNVAQYIINNYQDELYTYTNATFILCLANPTEYIKKCDLANEDLHYLIGTYSMKRQANHMETCFQRLSKRKRKFLNVFGISSIYKVRDYIITMVFYIEDIPDDIIHVVLKYISLINNNQMSFKLVNQAIKKSLATQYLTEENLDDNNFFGFMEQMHSIPHSEQINRIFKDIDYHTKVDECKAVIKLIIKDNSDNYRTETLNLLKEFFQDKSQELYHYLNTEF